MGGNFWDWLPGNPQQEASTVKFAGTWIKDKAASDPMCHALDLLGMGGIRRAAIGTLKGMCIQQHNTTCTFTMFSAVPWCKSQERVALDGSTSICRRRDLRSGPVRVNMKVPSSDKLLLSLAWDDPYAGQGTDVFSLHQPDTLHVDSTICVAGDCCSFKTVYRRRA